jgi:uncharacterized membrane protein
MNKNEFLSQLEKFLSDLPEEERREAMEYYVEYFDEAGPEKETDVLKEFGSPKEVADRIHDEFAEKGLIVYDPSVKEEDKEKDNGWKTACIILLCVVVAPVAIPVIVAVISAVLGAIIAVISAILGVFLAVCGATLAFAVAAVALFIVGIVKLFGTPLVGGLLLGLSLACAGLTLLLGFLIWKFCVVALPWMCKGIYNLCKKIFKKKEEAEA